MSTPASPECFVLTSVSPQVDSPIEHSFTTQKDKNKNKYTHKSRQTRELVSEVSEGLEQTPSRLEEEFRDG